jgi:hypothetical protein
VSERRDRAILAIMCRRDPLLVWALLLWGCGGGDETIVVVQAPSCAPHEIADAHGGCVPTGVLPELCGDGFEPDGAAGCAAVLPDEPCGPGTMAVPGDTSCAEVAACADGRWGDIPTDATTQFVDASYTSDDSDGSEQRPWRSVAEAYAAAVPGAILALAEGTYVTNVSITGKPVRLWGRCPRLVTLTSPPLSSATIHIRAGANGTEFRNLSFGGPNTAIAQVGSHDVLAEGVWFHDNQRIALVSEDAVEVGSLTVRRSLFENNGDLAMLISGVHVAIEQVAIRDTAPTADGSFGGAIEIDAGFATLTRAYVTMKSLLIERSHDVGVVIHGSDASLEASLIRDMFPASDGRFGRAVDIEDDKTSGLHSTAMLTGSVIERVYDIGIFLAGSEMGMSGVVVRDVQPTFADGLFGRGIQVQDHPEILQRGSASIDASLVERCLDAAIVVGNSDLTLTRTLVRDTAPRAADGAFGDGLAVLRYIPAQGSAGQPSASANILSSLIDGANRAAISSFAAQVTIQDCQLSCSSISINGEDQDGVSYEFVDAGGNRCGCDEPLGECQVLSTMLVPPVPVP